MQFRGVENVTTLKDEREQITRQIQMGWSKQDTLIEWNDIFSIDIISCALQYAPPVLEPNREKDAINTRVTGVTQVIM